jgi:hypothetical protein
MKYQELEFSVREGVAWICINRPDALNTSKEYANQYAREVGTACGPAGGQVRKGPSHWFTANRR